MYVVAEIRPNVHVRYRQCQTAQFLNYCVMRSWANQQGVPDWSSGTRAKVFIRCRLVSISWNRSGLQVTHNTVNGSLFYRPLIPYTYAYMHTNGAWPMRHHNHLRLTSQPIGSPPPGRYRDIGGAAVGSVAVLSARSKRKPLVKWSGICPWS